MLTKKEFFKDTFNQIVILSPTYKNNIDKWSFVCSRNVLVESKNGLPRKENYTGTFEKKNKFNIKITALHDDIDDFIDIIEDITNCQQSFIEEFGKADADKILIVLDDFLGSKVLKSNTLMSNYQVKTYKNQYDNHYPELLWHFENHKIEYYLLVLLSYWERKGNKLYL